MTAAVDRHRAPSSLLDRVMAVMPDLVTGTLVVLFLGTTTCSLVMSANATMTYATSHAVPVAIQWAPVGILELVQVAGTIWWLSSTGWSRLGAVLMVSGTSAVTAVMSCELYGWVGLIAPVGMVATIHAIACVVRPPREVQALIDDAVTHLDLDGWTKRTARERARELGVGQAGTVAEIVGRIREVEARQA